MSGDFTANEQYYRRTVSSIGISMLTLWLLMRVFGILLPVMQAGIYVAVSSDLWADIIYQLIYAAAYFLIFTAPVIVLRRSFGRRGFVYTPMKAELRLSLHLPAIVLGGILLIFAQSCLNEALVSIFNYSAFAQQVLWGEGEMRGYEVVLSFIVMALVPAFCEELLFRGAILTNLLPFGRSSAILISALLFSLMHQNPGQILYAFAAGILLGVVYERTGSIWNCVFLHLLNNFSSLTMGVLSEKLHSDPSLGGALAEILICFLCAGGVVLLVNALSPKKEQFKSGVFGKSFPAADSYVPCRISPNRSVALFFTVPMILFFALSITQIINLIGKSVVFSYA